MSPRQAARTTILYAFDLIEPKGGNRDRPFLDRKATLALPRLALCSTNALPTAGLPSSPMSGLSGRDQEPQSCARGSAAGAT